MYMMGVKNVNLLLEFPGFRAEHETVCNTLFWPLAATKTPFSISKKAGNLPPSPLHHSAFEMNYATRRTHSLAENIITQTAVCIFALFPVLTSLRLSFLAQFFCAACVCVHMCTHINMTAPAQFTTFPVWNRLQTLQSKKNEKASEFTENSSANIWNIWEDLTCKELMEEDGMTARTAPAALWLNTRLM